MATAHLRRHQCLIDGRHGACARGAFEANEFFQRQVLSCIEPVARTWSGVQCSRWHDKFAQFSFVFFGSICSLSRFVFYILCSFVISAFSPWAIGRGRGDGTEEGAQCQNRKANEAS